MTNTKELDLSMLVDWVLWDGHEDTDFQLTYEEVEGLPALFLQDDVRFDYNQWKQKWSKKSCTIFSAIGAISDLWNYQFPLSEVKEYDDLSYTLGRKDWYGWYTKEAIEMSCKKWNQDHPDMPVVFYSIHNKEDDKINKIIQKNYDFNISFNYTYDYCLDLAEDWCIDRANRNTKTIVSHAVCQIYKDWCKSVKDNYAWSNKQYYKVKATNNDLWKANILHPWWYLIVKVAECNYAELKRMEKVKLACLNSLEANSRLREATNDATLKKKLHDTNEWIRNNNLKYIEQKTNELRQYAS